MLAESAPARTTITVDTSRMLNGAQFKRVHKALEHLYYLTLLSTSSPDRADPSQWASWLTSGTHLGVREPPHAVEPDDRFVESIYSGAHVMRISVNGNAEALSKVVKVVDTINRLRASTAGKDAAVRVNLLVADPDLQQTIVTPLSDALSTIGPEAAASGRALLEQSLVSLSIDDVTNLTAQLDGGDRKR